MKIQAITKSIKVPRALVPRLIQSKWSQIMSSISVTNNMVVCLGWMIQGITYSRYNLCNCFIFVCIVGKLFWKEEATFSELKQVRNTIYSEQYDFLIMKILNTQFVCIILSSSCKMLACVSTPILYLQKYSYSAVELYWVNQNVWKFWWPISRVHKNQLQHLL